MKVVLVGPGRMGERHASKMFQLGVEPAVVFRKIGEPAANAAKMQQVREKAFNIFKKEVPVFDSLEEAACAFKPDAAIIATPTPLHFSQANFFLSSRIPVLVEKPCTLSQKEDWELSALAEANKTVLMVAYIERHSPAVAALLNAGVLEGLGSIRQITAVRTSLMNNREHPFVNLGVHDMDIMQWVLGEQWPDLISASQTFAGEKINCATANVRFNGCSASIILKCSAEPERRMEITGMDGTAEINFSNNEFVASLPRHTIAVPGNGTDKLLMQLQAFLNAVENGLSAKNSGKLDRWLFNTGTVALAIMQEAAEIAGRSTHAR